MQFQVPQNITLEDRIVGPFTAIQFGILMLGGGTAYVLFITLPPPVNEFVGGGIALFTFILAVGKFNDQPLYRFIKYIVFFIIKPKTRVWHKEGKEAGLISPVADPGEAAHNRSTKKISREDITRLAHLLDTRGGGGAIPKVAPKTATTLASPPAKPKT
ncbi:PrgI family protein [Patescibacteria group bacterium]|nr:PrgI family protein [Patescibacteria group bacterium]